MVLSDRTIARLLADGRIEIDPYDESLLQPSSVDVRVDRYFRVFHNARYPFIDVKQPQEDLTELVEIDDERPFILHPGEFVLGSTLERVRLPDDLVARLEGKALALDTPVPTTQGWKTMADVHDGDLVFDEAGEPTVVVAATQPMHGRPCREVVFSDGTTVVCDVGHQWQTVDKEGRRYGVRRSRVRTTGEIEESLVVRGEWNHQVPLELLGSKHIPGQYLIASIEQRKSLLQGLMDTDGYVDRFGRCDLTTVNESVAAGARELVASLGFRPTVAKKRAFLNGIDCGPKYEVQFTPDRPVFRLQGKLARQKTSGQFHRFRAIVDVREVPSIPVRCIEVASPRGLFLITRSFIATHNSSLGRLGLLIHSTAGFIDPGWNGHVTLELSNVANLPITIYYGMKIGQLSFVQLSEPAAAPYGSSGLGSKYQGQLGPTPSRYWQNFLATPENSKENKN